MPTLKNSAFQILDETKQRAHHFLKKSNCSISIPAYVKQVHNFEDHNPCVATAIFWVEPSKHLFSIQPPTKKADARTLVVFQHWLHWNTEKMVCCSYRALHLRTTIQCTALVCVCVRENEEALQS